MPRQTTQRHCSSSLSADSDDFNRTGGDSDLPRVHRNNLVAPTPKNCRTDAEQWLGPESFHEGAGVYQDQRCCLLAGHVCGCAAQRAGNKRFLKPLSERLPFHVASFLCCLDFGLKLTTSEMHSVAQGSKSCLVVGRSYWGFNMKAVKWCC